VVKSGNNDRSLQYLFDSMPYKNEFSWSMMVWGFAKAGKIEVARSLLNETPRKNAQTPSFLFILKINK
jgi:pentatricopeptide repeat protein